MQTMSRTSVGLAGTRRTIEPSVPVTARSEKKREGEGWRTVHVVIMNQVLTH